MLRDLKAEALAQIEALGGQPMLVKLLEKLDAQIDYNSSDGITVPTSPTKGPPGAGASPSHAAGAGARAGAGVAPGGVSPSGAAHASGAAASKPSGLVEARPPPLPPAAAAAAAQAEAIAGGRGVAPSVGPTGARPGPPLRQHDRARVRTLSGVRTSSSGSTGVTPAPGYASPVDKRGSFLKRYAHVCVMQVVAS